MKHRLSALTGFFCLLMMFPALLFFCPAGIAGGSPQRVLVLPLSIHSEKKVPFLTRGILDMMTSRISPSAKVIQQTDGASGKTPIQQGREMNADYVVSGSVTLFDNSVSTDATLTRVETGEAVLRFSQFGQSGGDVLAHVNQFATQINQYLSAPPAAATGAVMAVPAAPTPPAATTPPASVPSASAAVPGTPPPTAFSLKTAKLWTSQPFRGVISTLTTADVRGNGKPDIIFIHDKQVVVMTKNGSRLERVASFDTGSRHTVISVDAGDFNGNQTSEIFVTRLTHNNQLDSMVLEWNGSALSPIAISQPWYFRVINIPQKGPTLLGQRRGIPANLDTGGLYTDAFFLPGIFELTRQGSGYAAGPRMAAPNDHNLYQVALGPVFNDGAIRAIAYSAGDRLRIYDPAGAPQWSDSETLGGSPFFMTTRSGTDSRTQDRFYLSQRLIPADLDGDGTVEVVTVHNRELTRGMVERFRKYTRGRIKVLKWNQVGMKTVWDGEEITGYISDFSVADLDGDGKPEAIYAMVTHRGLFKSDISQIVVEPLGSAEIR